LAGFRQFLQPGLDGLVHACNSSRKSSPDSSILFVENRELVQDRKTERKPAMRICLFEDCHALDFEPLTWTRPVFSLLCGQSSLASKQMRYFAPCRVGAIVRPYLEEVYVQAQPAVHVNDEAWLCSGPTVLVNGRWLPPVGALADLTIPCVALCGEEVAYACVPGENLAGCGPDSIDDFLQHWKATLHVVHAGGMMVRHLWDLIDQNELQLTQDFPGASGTVVPEDVAVVGPRDRLLIDPTAHLDPMIVIDVTAGPVVIDRQATITAFTRLEGPCYIGPGCQVLGARIRRGTTLGPQCRIGGEVENAIVQGFSNKYHDGFLGHAYVGEWVNLGAGTQNSDLRNDYGEVTVVVNGQRVRTGKTKVGCFLGDHTRTAIGTLLNTGANVGVFCNLVPSAGLMPRYVPSFSSLCNGTLVDNGELPRLLETARRAMSRRGQELTSAQVALYQTLQAQTAGERQRIFRESEQKRLRRSA
jgi:UDP-N-acetylglucosamine diphosphorylase/glucosamine-1-phosphate N-acetyltransferase